ncbi:hypothetical protein KCU99_g4777, partial [Aureobasidium melanogenum]
MIDNERGRVTKRPLRPCGKRHHHRAASHIARSEKITTDDYAKPLLLPRRILWCGKGGAAEKWLRRTYLPWWFFGSFINRCYYHRSGKGTLTQCLRRYPMDEQALIKFWSISMSWNTTVIPPLFSKKHKKSFFGKFSKPQRWIEEEKEFLRINPTGRPTFSLPTRSEVSHPVTTSTHAQRIPNLELSRQRQADDTLNLPASVSEKKSLALDPARSRTLPMPLRPSVRQSISIRTAPKEVDQYHGFLVLRSQTRINRGNFFVRYQRQSADL